MNFMRDQNFGVTLQSPTDKEITQSVGTYFVDNNELMMLENVKKRSLQNRLARMQEMVSLYSEIMEITGAALVNSIRNSLIHNPRHFQD